MKPNSCFYLPLQARYRQYFEESPLSPGASLLPGSAAAAAASPSARGGAALDDGLLPMETQVLMQEVLTDGIALCSLM